MALFGYPVAQENDAERALRAALSIQRSLAELNRRTKARASPHWPHGSPSTPARRSRRRDFRRCSERRGAGAGARRSGCGCGDGAGQRQVVGLFVAEECGNYELKGVPERITLYRCSGQRWWAPSRAAASHTACRPRRRTRHADATLGARAARRWATGNDRRRTRPW